ncbi:MAG TPA: GGDEF domain-containing protein [Solirubrobacteraceae bacterium]
MDARTPPEGDLHQRIAELEEALERAEREAITDALTGCVNRRGWDRLLATEEDRCARHGLDAVVMVIDLDKFKAVNDTSGHAAGDELLRRCSRLLHATVRSHDAVARTGGDEFALLAVQTSGDEAPATLIARMRTGLARAGLDATVAAVTRARAGTLAAAWRGADQEMLAAKRAARFGRGAAG